LEGERNGTETALLRESRRDGTELRWEDGTDELLLLLFRAVVAELLRRLESELLRLELELLRLLELKLRRRLLLEWLERTERSGNFLDGDQSWTRSWTLLLRGCFDKSWATCWTFRFRGGFGRNENWRLRSLETGRWCCWASLWGWCHAWGFGSDDWSLILWTRRIWLSVLISVHAVPILVCTELVIFSDVSATL
jgi:hypothetical protein